MTRTFALLLSLLAGCDCIVSAPPLGPRDCRYCLWPEKYLDCAERP